MVLVPLLLDLLERSGVLVEGELHLFHFDWEFFEEGDVFFEIIDLHNHLSVGGKNLAELALVSLLIDLKLNLLLLNGI